MKEKYQKILECVLTLVRMGPQSENEGKKNQIEGKDLLSLKNLLSQSLQEN